MHILKCAISFESMDTSFICKNDAKVKTLLFKCKNPMTINLVLQRSSKINNDSLLKILCHL